MISNKPIFFSREKVTKPKAQIGFIKFVLLPMFDAVARLFPKVSDKKTYPAIKCKWYKDSLYCSELVRHTDLRLSFLFHKISAVLDCISFKLMSLRPCSMNFNEKQTKIIDESRFFILKKWPISTLSCTISKRFELQPWDWSWIVDNLI